MCIIFLQCFLFVNASFCRQVLCSMFGLWRQTLAWIQSSHALMVRFYLSFFLLVFPLNMSCFWFFFLSFSRFIVDLICLSLDLFIILFCILQPVEKQQNLASLKMATCLNLQLVYQECENCASHIIQIWCLIDLLST